MRFKTVKYILASLLSYPLTKDDSKWFNRAYNTIASNIIKNQTADVDVVSGATYSSMGIKEGVANALINAGGKNAKAISLYRKIALQIITYLQHML